MQFAKVIGNTELFLAGIVFTKQYAEIIVAHVRRKVITYDPFDTLIGLMIDNIGFEYLNRGEAVAIALDINIDRNNFKLKRVAVAT